MGIPWRAIKYCSLSNKMRAYERTETEGAIARHPACASVLSVNLSVTRSKWWLKTETARRAKAAGFCGTNARAYRER